MPGSIHVSVLDAFNLSETNSDGKDVAVKVSIGAQEYITVSSKAVDGKTQPWNTDFVFPVLNLRDNLLVELLDETREMISRNEISTATIVERHAFDIDLALDKGGKINLRLRFMLTEEERQRIDMMRAAALKRREEMQKRKEATVNKVLIPMSGEMQNGDSIQQHAQSGDGGSQFAFPTIEDASVDKQKYDGDKSHLDGPRASESENDASTNTVKAKIKAFETSPHGAVDQSKMLLRSSSEQWKAEIENLIQKDSSEKKTEETIKETSEKKMAPQPGPRVEVIEETETATIEKRKVERYQNSPIKGTKSTRLGTSIQILAGVSLVAAGALVWALSNKNDIKSRIYQRNPQKKQIAK